MKKYYITKLIGDGRTMETCFRPKIHGLPGVRGYEIALPPDNEQKNGYAKDECLVLVEAEDFTVIEKDPDNIPLATEGELKIPVDEERKAKIQDDLAKRGLAVVLDADHERCIADVLACINPDTAIKGVSSGVRK